MRFTSLFALLPLCLAFVAFQGTLVTAVEPPFSYQETIGAFNREIRRTMHEGQLAKAVHDTTENAATKQRAKQVAAHAYAEHKDLLIKKKILESREESTGSNQT